MASNPKTASMADGLDERTAWLALFLRASAREVGMSGCIAVLTEKLIEVDLSSERLEC